MIYFLIYLQMARSRKASASAVATQVGDKKKAYDIGAKEHCSFIVEKIRRINKKRFAFGINKKTGNKVALILPNI